MRKIIFMVLLFTSIVLSQNFQIKDLGAHGAPANTDIFLFSNSAGALTKLSWLAMHNALDAENWLWTGTHAFDNTVTISNLAGNITATGDWTNSGDWDFDGQFLMSTPGETMILGTAVNFSQAGGSTFSVGGMATFEDDTLRTGEETNFYLQGSMSLGYDSILVSSSSYDIDLDPEDDRLSNFIELIASSSSKRVISITGGKEGQRIVLMGDPDLSGEIVTIQHNADIQLADGISIDLDQGDMIDLMYHDGVWYEIEQAAGMGTYGTMGFGNEAETLTMAEDVYAPITNVGNDLYTDGIEVGDLVWTGDSIQVTTAGNYEINWDLSFSGANADIYHIGIFVNNVKQANKGEAERDMTGTSIGVASGNTMLTISATHWVTLRIMNEANNNDATVYASNINITKK